MSLLRRDVYLPPRRLECKEEGECAYVLKTNHQTRKLDIPKIRMTAMIMAATPPLPTPLFL